MPAGAPAAITADRLASSAGRGPMKGDAEVHMRGDRQSYLAQTERPALQTAASPHVMKRGQRPTFL